jgi:hypothetical protein
MPCKGISEPRFTAQKPQKAEPQKFIFKLLPTNRKIYSKSVGDGASTSRVQYLQQISCNTVGATTPSPAKSTQNMKQQFHKFCEDFGLFSKEKSAEIVSEKASRGDTSI